MLLAHSLNMLEEKYAYTKNDGQETLKAIFSFEVWPCTECYNHSSYVSGHKMNYQRNSRDVKSCSLVWIDGGSLVLYFRGSSRTNPQSLGDDFRHHTPICSNYLVSSIHRWNRTSTVTAKYMRKTWIICSKNFNFIKREDDKNCFASPLISFTYS